MVKNLGRFFTMKNNSLVGKWENDNSTFQFEIDEKETQAIVTFVIEGSYYPPLHTLSYKNISKIDEGVYEAEEYFREKGLEKYRACLIIIFQENMIVSRKNTLSKGYHLFKRAE